MLNAIQVCGNSDSDKKEIFLRNLSKHRGKLKYKRYPCSPLRYAGGKSLAVGLIIELIPNYIKKIKFLFNY